MHIPDHSQARLIDTYAFPGYRPLSRVGRLSHDPQARVVTLVRRSKKTTCGVCGHVQSGWYDHKHRQVRDLSCGDTRVYLQFEVRRIDCTQCGKVKTETIPFLANNPFYTERFGQYVGERCRNASIQSVAKELRLDWQKVKAL